MSRTFLNILHALTHVILTTVQWRGDYYLEGKTRKVNELCNYDSGIITSDSLLLTLSSHTQPLLGKYNF